MEEDKNIKRDQESVKNLREKIRKAILEKKKFEDEEEQDFLLKRL